ncbi:uncharacterized protein LOC111099988 [Crassostrea virginica]
MKTTAVVLVALVGIVYGDFSYPRGGGSSYSYPGPGYPLLGHGTDLDLPPYCNTLNCFIPACDVTRCRNFPYARCVGFCNSCVARFFIGHVNVTPFCGGSRPGKPNRTY